MHRIARPTGRAARASVPRAAGAGVGVWRFEPAIRLTTQASPGPIPPAATRARVRIALRGQSPFEETSQYL